MVGSDIERRERKRVNARGKEERKERKGLEYYIDMARRHKDGISGNYVICLDVGREEGPTGDALSVFLAFFSFAHDNRFYGGTP